MAIIFLLFLVETCAFLDVFLKHTPYPQTINTTAHNLIYQGNGSLFLLLSFAQSRIQFTWGNANVK